MMLKKRIFWGFLVIITILLMAFSLTGCGGGGNSPSGDGNKTTSKKIAYIYTTSDGTIPAALTSMTSYQITGITMSQVDTTDFTSFDLIIIGPKTNTGSSWDTGSQATTIYNANKPIIGMGDGGSNFFKAMGQPHFNNTMGYHTNDLTVVNTADVIWSTPNSINIDTTGHVNVTVQSGGIVTELNPNSISSSVTIFAKDNKTDYYLIAKEGRYLFWGPNDGADELTSDGKKLFVNAINLMMQ